MDFAPRGETLEESPESGAAHNAAPLRLDGRPVAMPHDPGPGYWSYYRDTMRRALARFLAGKAGVAEVVERHPTRPDDPPPEPRSDAEKDAAYYRGCRWDSLVNVATGVAIDAEASLIQAIVAGDPLLKPRGSVAHKACKRYWPARGVVVGGRLVVMAPEEDAELLGVGKANAREDILMRIHVLGLSDVMVLDGPPPRPTRPPGKGDARIRECIDHFEKARRLGDRSFSEPHFTALGRALCDEGYGAAVRGGRVYLSPILPREMGDWEDEYGCEVFRTGLILDLDDAGESP